MPIRTADLLLLVHQIANIWRPSASREEILLVASLIQDAFSRKAEVIDLCERRKP